MSALVDYHGNPIADAHVWLNAPLVERVSFASKLFAGTVEQCWVFVGALESVGGYGRWRPPGGAVTSTHRWSFVAHHGPTDEPVVRHDCDVRCCANPHHLTDGTQAQNIRDTVERGAWRTIALPIWPARAFQLRDAAIAGDRASVDELCTRPRQLRLFDDADAR